MNFAVPERPRGLVYALLPLLHFASVKLTFLCAVTPENEVVVWLPNAVLLAALLHFRGQRGVVMAALTFCSDVTANLGAFSWQEAVLLSGVNLAEVFVTYSLMRRAQTSPRLERIQDFGKFIVAGPLAGALMAGLMGAAVLKVMQGTATPYLTLVRLWWFGDGLGLLIYTPLLLAFTQPAPTMPRLHRLDIAILLLSLGLAVVVFTSRGGQIGEVSVTPTLLLPSTLFLAVRFGLRWTALGVALISLLLAWVLSHGHQPFGAVDIHLEIVRAQEFIFTLCTIGIGFAIVLAQLTAHERELEHKVRERTQALESSNTRLATLSATDGLTGIANRRRFDEVLAGEWRRAARSGQALTLVMLDVDFFKAYNDHYGHLAGDDCLRRIAALLSAQFRRTGDVLARYGGEEFVLLTSAHDAADAWLIAETARQSLQTMALPHAMSPFGTVTASLGVAMHVPVVGESVDVLLRRADQALYQAKAQGRNRTSQ
ncbi:hypothetical protein RD110_25050 [Rhodoferax koreense]|uniref:diguanylate cyclase n=1 Tax=Rhodoferax koreensis TaxID=1842727 RepID=A0A1P8K245_9BURK|nr:diguanylate cyclase [Rhodoferax koreense]APW40067.1 hypothetical protein RD110_25050 [Rhodoferax koreense]